MHSTVTLVLGLSKNSIWVFWLLVVISAFHTVVLQVRPMLSYHVLFCTFAFCHTLLSTTILYHCPGTNKISGDQFRKCHSHSSCVQVVPRTNVCVFSPGAARGGPGVSQVIHQSPVQVSLEESENHAVQSHPAGRLRLHPGCRGERTQLSVNGDKRQLCHMATRATSRLIVVEMILKFSSWKSSDLSLCEKSYAQTFASLSNEC